MRVVVCGCNGAGKSTLGRALGEVLRWPFLDIEDYYFPAENRQAGYAYGRPRTREEAAALLAADLGRYEDCVLASVRANYGPAVESAFDAGILLETPREERLRRVRARSFRKFGSRMLEGGDLYEAEEAFFRMVAGRRETEPEEWLRGLGIPVLRLSGEDPVTENVRAAAEWLRAFPAKEE